MYTVNLVGLIYLDVCEMGEKKMALVPNGTKGGDGVPEHHASLFIETDHVEDDNWWPAQSLKRPITLEYKLGKYRTVDVQEFRIPKHATLTFESKKDVLTNVNLESGLPILKQIDPSFALDPKADTIAKVPITGGDLEVFRFGSSAVVRWKINKGANPMTITAKTATETKSVTLTKSNPKSPTEIVFSNTIELLTPAKDNGSGTMGSAAMASMPAMPAMPAGASHTQGTNGNGHAGHGAGAHGYAGHFVLYSKLDKARDESKFENPTLPDFDPLRPLPFRHPYLAFLSTLEEVPDKPCVPSCC